MKTAPDVARRAVTGAAVEVTDYGFADLQHFPTAWGHPVQENASLTSR
jgi:hypothetical protein